MTAQRDTPCKCGWKFHGFHICVDLTGDEPKPRIQSRKKLARSQSHLDALNSGRADRWARHYEENRERDEKIIERYAAGGIGTSKIAQEFGMARSSVLKVLKRAQDQGLVKVRARGTTLAKGAQ